MASEHSEKPSSPPSNPWLAPFEAGRQWMEIAGKGQKVLAGAGAGLLCQSAKLKSDEGFRWTTMFG